MGGNEYRLLYPQRDITINDTNDGFNVNQQGTGDIIEFFDNGVSVFRIADGGGITSTGSYTYADDALLRLGTDGDIVFLNRSTALGANTPLTSVLIGTPVTPAIALNSLIISNVTASGDILLVGNLG